MPISTLEDLIEHFGADSVQGLNRRIWKDTDCGASISVKTPDGKWHHNGQDWSGITEIVAFTLQSIVEGSDAEVNGDQIDLPVDSETVDRCIEWIEGEVSILWDEANGVEELADDD